MENAEKSILDEKLFYRLVAKQHVHVGHHLHEAILEKLRDKRRGQVQAKQLVAFRGVLGHLQDGLHGNGQEKSLEATRRRHVVTHLVFFAQLSLTATITHSNVVDVSLFYQLPVFFEV